MNTAYIGVGSNVDRRKHIEAAINELSAIGQDLRLSTIYECEAVGFESSAFYNLVVEVRTHFGLAEFSQRLREIEVKWGRDEQAKKFQPRTVDLDIILFGQQTSLMSPELPRSDIYKYGFVIEPLNELCGELCVPGDGRTVRQIWSQVRYQETLSRVDIWFNY
ncbi:2-amino-4-hydroxy-6-hydroxymethyldihydropteridine diphosphokinase [Vibrio ostreicida]|uniref:2-amino-4-hydroxy-6-hydroxymethyldihydropteridine diphosphokinase n=1 Tax=Vibrio ostreicida TaxID=526588 RepID=A0ABT8BPI6_9VIBR|nr:2-amino-4-hydroxy-6-hydroxymethyldihydropteridine diphosphokinase [Vibrio ostreicida]MDN3609030.1 2-amino-4-hydroxy-6-hydroxymethyldihydropteridine diphosphokinase [Vibrio ostreicida]NPD07926.1 2-amino-4-hydroxy-6-hydroxymethyldihydropteridine diphosphokinase [Vibrio ostreicida]